MLGWARTAHPSGVRLDNRARHGPALDDELGCPRELPCPDASGTDSGGEGGLDEAAGRIPTGVQDARHRVRRLQAARPIAHGLERRHGSVSRIEGDTERDEVENARGPLLRQHANGRRVAQPGPGVERVARVQLRTIVAEHRSRDTALRPRRRTRGQHVFRDDRHIVVPRGPDRGDEPGHAAADDKNVRHDVT